jgi:hypothetical protein
MLLSYFINIIIHWAKNYLSYNLALSHLTSDTNVYSFLSHMFSLFSLVQFNKMINIWFTQCISDNVALKI